MDAPGGPNRIPREAQNGLKRTQEATKRAPKGYQEASNRLQVALGASNAYGTRPKRPKAPPLTPRKSFKNLRNSSISIRKIVIFSLYAF